MKKYSTTKISASNGLLRHELNFTCIGYAGSAGSFVEDDRKQPIKTPQGLWLYKGCVFDVYNPNDYSDNVVKYYLRLPFFNKSASQKELLEGNPFFESVFS